MEALIFILIGTAIFCQSWYVLGMYTEGRTTGVVMGSLGAVGLAGVAVGPALPPTLLTGANNMVASSNLFMALLLVWSVYAVVVAAHAIWDLEERAVGFLSAIVAGVSLVATIYFFVELRNDYGDAVWLATSCASLIFTLLSGLVFFYHAVPFRVLRLLTGWSMLIGGGGVVLIGALIASEVLAAT